MFLIDGDVWPPSPHGTGTEDYVNCAWGFPSEEHAGRYQGITLGSSVQEHAGRWTMYRFYVEELVRSGKSLRGTIVLGHANDEASDYSNVAHWYQSESETTHAELALVDDRLPRRWPSTAFGTNDRSHGLSTPSTTR